MSLVARGTARSRVAVGLVGVLASLSAAACGGSSPAGSDNADADATKVGLSTIGPRNDRSFSQAHFEGVTRAEAELDGVSLAGVVENADTSQARIDAFKNLALGNDLIVGGSAGFADAAPAVAPQYKDKHFIVSTGATKDKYDNVTSLVPDEGLAAVPAGAVMAKLSKSKVIGFIGGAEIPPTMQSLDGVKAGAASVDENVKVSSTIVGDFNDVAKAKSGAEALIAAGADQIFAFLDAGIEGVYQAAEGTDVGVYQIISLRCDEAASVVGSAIEDAGLMIFDAIERFKKGELEAGTTFYGLTSPQYLRFELCPAYADRADIADLVKKTTEDVISGALKLPAAVTNARPGYAVTEK